jgi:transcriptional regulator with XRE-family HTH domain
LRFCNNAQKQVAKTSEFPSGGNFMTIFWERFSMLCDEKGIKPNSIREELGLSSTGTITSWKNRDVVPEELRLARISEYFGVSVGYLLGYTDVRSLGPGIEKAPHPEGQGDAAQQLDEAMSKLTVDELRQLRDYARFLMTQRDPAAP